MSDVGHHEPVGDHNHEALAETAYSLLEYGLHVGAVREVASEGLRTLVDQTGVWLVFTAPDGKRAVAHTGIIAKLSGGLAGEAIRSWAQARRAAAQAAGV